MATKKLEPIETRMKKACADLYKVISAFPEPPQSITVEGKTLQLLYSQDRGVVSMYVQRQSEEEWFPDIPNFNITLEDLKALKEPKNIGSIVKDEDNFHIKLLKEDATVTIKTFTVAKNMNPVAQLVESMEWDNCQLPPGAEQIQINLKTGQVGVPGTQSIADQPASVLYLNKRNIPKPFLIGESLFSLLPEDENFGTPYGLFMTDKFVTLIKFKKILIDI